MTAPANFLFIMDPYETLNLETETSLLLMQELIERDQGVYWLQPEDLALEHNQPMGRVFQVTGTDPLRRAEPACTNLNRFDAVLVRKDPPFDTGYLQLTLILDHLDPDIAQFNDVKALRDFNEGSALNGLRNQSILVSTIPVSPISQACSRASSPFSISPHWA